MGGHIIMERTRGSIITNTAFGTYRESPCISFTCTDRKLYHILLRIIHIHV